MLDRFNVLLSKLGGRLGALTRDKLVLRRLRGASALLATRLRLRLWFPQVPLALLLMLGGFLLLDNNFAGHWSEYFHLLLANQKGLSPALLPPLLIGGGMLLMAVGLLLRSRLAWVITLLLVTVAIISVALEPSSHQLLLYFVLVLVVLFLSWRNFNRASVTASSLFALTSIAMLMGYATFGAYYLGAEFGPPITDLVTAFYWSIVTMSTVGYGDISPKSPDAMLFTVSVIVLGLTVFATALTAVIAPMVSRSLARIVHHQGATMKREKHFVVIGATFLATNTAEALQKRGLKVTRLFRSEPHDKEAGDFDKVVGDPSNSEVLRTAGVAQAEAVLAMLADDSENAFVVLAVRELAPQVETVVAVNDASHLDRIKLVQPDVLITPQLLGGELTAMLLSGETVTPEFITHNIFKRLRSKTA